jgi:hypothetical protein
MLVKLLSFALLYFSESGLSNGLKPIQIKKIIPAPAPAIAPSSLLRARSVRSLPSRNFCFCQDNWHQLTKPIKLIDICEWLWTWRALSSPTARDSQACQLGCDAWRS